MEVYKSAKYNNNIVPNEYYNYNWKRRVALRGYNIVYQL